MENQLKQFTFYDFYYEAIKQLPDEEAGKLIKRICNFTLFNRGDVQSKEAETNTMWEIILPTLTEATEIERRGKKPYYLNRKMQHFSFLLAYAKVIDSISDNKKAGEFIKAVCEYMLFGKEPEELTPPLDGNFRLLKKSFDISRVRKETGCKGGKVVKNPNDKEQFTHTENAISKGILPTQQEIEDKILDEIEREFAEEQGSLFDVLEQAKVQANE